MTIRKVSLNKILASLEKYSRPLSLYEVYKKFIMTYKSVDKKQIHVEEVENYEYIDIDKFHNLLNIFNYKWINYYDTLYYSMSTVDNYRIIQYEKTPKAIMFMHNSIIGRSGDPRTLYAEVREMYDNIEHRVREKYRKSLDIDYTGMSEEVGYIDNEPREKTFGDMNRSVWKEENLEINVGNKKINMKTFIKKNDKNTLIVIPKKEKEKVYLSMFSDTYLKNSKLADGNNISLLEIIEPYEIFANVFIDKRKFLMVRHSLKTPFLSVTLLKTILNDKTKNISKVNILYRSLEKTNEIVTYEITKSKNYFSSVKSCYITIAPKFIIKTPYDPSKIIETIPRELFNVIDKSYNVTTRLETFNHGFLYRIKNGNERKKWLIIPRTTESGIDVSIKVMSNYAIISSTQVGKYVAKKLAQEMLYY